MKQNKKKIIGITGGIGTGKSTVSKYLIRKGYPVIDSDLIARKIVEKGSNAYKKIIKEFGEDIIDLKGEINRKKLASIVFNDKKKLEKLNIITHFEIRNEMLRKIQSYTLKGYYTIFCDVPLLFESHMENLFDEIWLVYASREIQISRIILRDNFTQREAIQRIENQMDIEEKKLMANIIIENIESFEKTYKIIDKLLEDL